MNCVEIAEKMAKKKNCFSSDNSDFNSRLSIKMNTSLNLNYCLLPSQHLAHQTTFSTNLVEFLPENEEENLILFNLASKTEQEAADKSNKLNEDESVQSNQEIQTNQLDPYIDAVHVKSRLEQRKKGARVRPAAANKHAQQLVAISRQKDFEPKSSYYSKTVHIEESQEDDEHWDDGYDDSDSDEHDDHYHSKKKKHHHKGKGKGKKRIYVKKYPKKHHHSEKGHHHHKKHHEHDYHGKKYHHKSKPKKKVAYAYVYKPEGKHHHYGHDKHDHYDHHHDYKKLSKKKLVHLDLMDKGKMSVAGLLGYTLLCVNYLMVLQQPTYDKYSSSYYTKYAPHGGKGDVVELKSAGPVLLAHCADLPTTLKPVYPPQVTDLMKLGQSSLSKTNQSLAKAASHHHYDDHSHHDDYDSSSYYHSPAASPPSYYYTLAPNSQYRRSGGLFSPIENYLNRLLLPTGGGSGAYDAQAEPIQVVRSPQQRARIIQQTNNQRANLLVNNRNNRLVLVQDGPAQVINTKDNLVNLRTRPVDVQMQVIRSRFAGPQRAMNLVDDVMFQNQWTRRGPLDNLGVQVAVAVRVPGGRQLAEPLNSRQQQSGPEAEAEAEPADQPQSDEPQPLLGNNQVLDLPDYALTGDSIRLTCNHRIPVGRLYSVKWFKDSLEFYRFIPANGPLRTKSSLFLPEVRLDLARSNADSLFLRNVTHKSSGLYRCEAVSGEFSQKGSL